MTASNANIWTGPTGTLPVVNSNGQIYEEVQIATAGQTVFTLVTFNYTPGTKTINVFKNGVRLRRAVDYTETDTSHVTLTAGAALNDVISFSAFAISQILAPLQNNGVIPAGTNGQVLAKSANSDYALKWLDLSSIATLLDQPVQAVASAPTIDVTPYAATTRNLLITGTTQIDGWAITNGQVFVVKFAASLTLSNNVNQVTPTGAAIKVGPNDSCLVRATATNTVEILSFVKSTSVVPPYYNDHRLTLVSGSPVADSAAASTLYYTAYKGNNISLFNGTAWIVRQFTEISLALAGLTISRPYDVFVYDNAGTATIELLAWSSLTARATALSRQDGILVKGSDTTRRYVGTIVAISATTAIDSKRQRLVWNMYNRVRKNMSVTEAGNTWAGTGTYRQVNGNALNQLEFVAGFAEDAIDIMASNTISASIAQAAYAGVGIDSSIINSATVPGRIDVSASGTLTGCTARYNEIASVGYHSYLWLENAGGAATFYGAGSGAGGSGMTGTVMS